MKSCFLGVDLDLQIGNSGKTEIIKDFDPPAEETESLLCCIVQTMDYYNLYVMALDNPSAIYKKFLCDRCVNEEFRVIFSTYKDFYKDHQCKFRVQQYVGRLNYRLMARLLSSLDTWLFQTTQAFYLLFYCFHFRFEISRLDGEAKLKKKISYNTAHG